MFGIGDKACACDVIRPPNDFPPANKGKAGASSSAFATAARTAVCANAGASGRFEPRSM